MSDKRRRRRRASGESSDEDEEASITASDHEYESAAEEDSALEGSDLDQAETATNGAPEEDLTKIESKVEATNVEDVDDGILDLSDKEEVLEERQAGDGQEQDKNGKVDDDEDRRNPQYIPKKGMFYEHDDRIDSGDEEQQVQEASPSQEPDVEAKPKRVPRSETIDKWGHDKFLEREQAPKTKEELVSTYGYDIRNEDSAPRARRRRRYGRGPNKYTRNWEDEKAYEPGKEQQNSVNKASNSKRGGHRNSMPAERPSASAEKSAPNSSKRPVKIEDKDQFPDLPGSKPASVQKAESKAKEESKGPVNKSGGNKRERGSNPNASNNSRGGGKSKPNTSNTSSVNQRLHKEPRPPVPSQQSSEPKANKKLVEKAVEAKLDKVMDIIEQKAAKNSPKINRKMENGERNSQPEDSQNGRQANKRYSNSRQQTGPRSNNQEQQHPRRHQNQDFKKFNDINGSNSSPHPSTTYANANFPTNASGPPPAAPFLPAGVAAAAAAASVATPTSTSGFLDPSTMVNYGPPPPVQFTPVVPVTVTVPIVSGVPGAPPLDTLAVQLAPQLPNVTTPADQVLLAAAAAASHQGYAEVRGGVTYFNPTAQPPMMARPMSKRPKAAIPIVDPSQVTSTSTDHQEHNGQESTDQHLQQEMVKT